jgi:hypothetical protein
MFAVMVWQKRLAAAANFRRSTAPTPMLSATRASTLCRTLTLVAGNDKWFTDGNVSQRGGKCLLAKLYQT